MFLFLSNHRKHRVARPRAQRRLGSERVPASPTAPPPPLSGRPSSRKCRGPWFPAPRGRSFTHPVAFTRACRLLRPPIASSCAFHRRRPIILIRRDSPTALHPPLSRLSAHSDGFGLFGCPILLASRAIGVCKPVVFVTASSPALQPRSLIRRSGLFYPNSSAPQVGDTVRSIPSRRLAFRPLLPFPNPQTIIPSACRVIRE